ncbi:MAG: DUF2141 domain-containing protein [Prolixibacteraceae bacterium]|nr:DUF2141 domain-containing protein [Prolixibacteraceae bacterium]
MKHLLFFVLLSCPGFLKAQSKLEIEIANLRNSHGQIVIELMDAQKQTLKATRKKIENNQCIFIFNDLKNGHYAVQYFHDENSNGAIDTNIFGIPTEGFGFSNNAIGPLGPKKFEEWLFKISGDQKITIRTRYF